MLDAGTYSPPFTLLSLCTTCHLTGVAWERKNGNSFFRGLSSALWTYFICFECSICSPLIRWLQKISRKVCIKNTNNIRIKSNELANSWLDENKGWKHVQLPQLWLLYLTKFVGIGLFARNWLCPSCWSSFVRTSMLAWPTNAVYVNECMQDDTRFTRQFNQDVEAAYWPCMTSPLFSCEPEYSDIHQNHCH